MTEETKSTIVKAAKTTKLHVWKYFGAMFMETKDGQQAVSFTRIVAATLFIALMWKWSGFALHPEVPEYMIYTFWGLVGITGAQKVATSLKGTIVQQGEKDE